MIATPLWVGIVALSLVGRDKPACSDCVCVGGVTTAAFAAAASHAMIVTVVDQQPSEEPLAIDYTVVVFASWKGADGDTLRVRTAMAGDCTPDIRLGREYVWISTEREGVPFLDACDPVLERTAENMAAIVRVLGAPHWRSIEELEARLLAMTFASADSVTVSGSIRYENTMTAGAEIHIEGVGSVRSSERGSFMSANVAPGFYRFKVVLPNGRVETRLILARCYRNLASSRSCQALPRTVYLEG